MTEDTSSQGRPRASAREVFGERAAYYVTSTAHTDAQVLGRLVDLSGLSPDMSVLDIGTGTGHTALALAPHAGTVIGLDPTPEMLAEAEALRRERGYGNVSWMLGDVADLPWAANSFHVVACRRAAHHFLDIERALGEMCRVLRRGGRLMIDDRTVPNDPDLDVLLNQLDWLHDHSHVRDYSADEWRALCERAGLHVERVEGYTRHRHLSSLTEGVSTEDVAEIRRLLAALSPEQEGQLGLERRADGLWFDHYYLILSARRIS